MMFAAKGYESVGTGLLGTAPMDARHIPYYSIPSVEQNPATFATGWHKGKGAIRLCVMVWTGNAPLIRCVCVVK